MCSSNRKAQLINQYYPIIANWEKPYFLTLTRKSFKKDELYTGVRKTKNDLQKMIRRLQKRAIRGKGIKIECIVAMECNFNPIDKTYNPHFHIITKSKEIGVQLNIEWLKQNDKATVNFQAQVLKQIKNKEETLIEVIKYCTKIFTDPNMKKGKNRVSDPVIYCAALHEINKAFRGITRFGIYGFSLPKSPNNCNSKIISTTSIKDWSYVPVIKSYV